MPDTDAPDLVYYLHSEDIWRRQADLDHAKAAGIAAIAACLVDDEWMPVEHILYIRIAQIPKAVAEDLEYWLEDEDMPPEAMVVAGIVQRCVVRIGEMLFNYDLVDVEPYSLR